VNSDTDSEDLTAAAAMSELLMETDYAKKVAEYNDLLAHFPRFAPEEQTKVLTCIPIHVIWKYLFSISAIVTVS
jgi:hypothetical protein